MKNGPDKQEKDVRETFEEEVKKPYYNVFYLDNFKLPYEKLDVSIVIPTYNRCPYKPGTLKEDQNPLVWSLKTALLQRPRIKEIIVVDDQSQDYTPQVVKSFIENNQNTSIHIKYVRVPERKGISFVRNYGTRFATGKYIFFSDDDSFIAPYSAFGGVYTLERLEQRGLKIGAINLPTYGRESRPTKFLPQKEIGVIDFVHGIQKANKDAFIEEYIGDNPRKFLDAELQILNPIPILNLNTYAIVPKKVFEEVGGFPEHILKRMEDREFGCRITENGYQIFYQSDPKFHCVHGSYGLNSNRNFIGEDWFKKLDKSISIKKAMEICDSPKENTGARINSNSFLYDYILAFFCLIYERNKKGAINWINRVYDEFVKQGQTALFGNPKIPVPGELERRQMWISAINQGLKFVKDKHKKDISKIDLALRELKKQKLDRSDIISTIEKL